MDRSSSYDELPYGSNAVAEMHPNRMATVARLFGLDPAPVRTCRLLEIGCAEGGNAIPLALALPEARVVGIDLSERQIAIGKECISELGLSNVELVRADLAELGPDFGPFDYVCAHGVYSWVAPCLQEKLLAACHALLSPDGIAYVSYNTFPGWSVQLVLREMGLYRARREGDAVRKIGAARRLLDGVAGSATAGGDAYRALLASHWKALESYNDEYLFHDHFELDNNPCWFHELASKAEAAGLTYVADALLGTTPVTTVDPGIVRALEGIAGDRFEREQYLDFLRFRSFRQSLFCRSGRTPLAEPDLSVLDRLHAVTLVCPRTTPVDLRASVAVEFVSPRGAILETGDPVLKAALAHLWDRSPEAVSFAELSRLPSFPRSGSAEEDLGRLRRSLLGAYADRFVDLLEHVPAYVRRPGDRPAASPLARRQAGRRCSQVTSLLHRNLILEGIPLLVLSRLDGTRDAETLARETTEVIVSEVLLRDPAGKGVTDPSIVRPLVDEAMGPILEGLAMGALLTA